MTFERQIAAFNSAWAAVAPVGYEENIHVLTQREIVLPDGLGSAIAHPALVYYAAATEAEGDSPDGRRGKTTTQYVLSFRDPDYNACWSYAEAFREEMRQLPAGLGFSDWVYANDDFGVDLSIAGKLVPRKVALVEFTR